MLEKPISSDCKINVLFKLRNGEYVLTVSDNGVGIPPELDWQTTESLGLKLVKIWATYQLGGTLELDRQYGTTFTIKFPQMTNQ